MFLFASVESNPPIVFRNSRRQARVNYPCVAKQRGFTVIELVVVIALLGVLSAVALPRFLDMNREATIATMEGVVGALETAITLSHSQAFIDGTHTQPSATITVEDRVVSMVNGYPAGTATGIPQLIESPPGDWKQRASSYAGAWVYWHGTIDEDAGTAQCYVRYRQSTAVGMRPIIDFQDSGC